MNKAQWNSVYYTGNIPRDLVLELINHSYRKALEGFSPAALLPCI